MEGRPGGIFEIFQNGHIFLKFLFLKNIKKEKTVETNDKKMFEVEVGICTQH